MTNYLLLGGSGFIGASLALSLAQEPGASIKVTCRHPEEARRLAGIETVQLIRSEFDCGCNFLPLVNGADVVVHMVSTTNPACSNRFVPDELGDIATTAKLLEACCAAHVSRFVFISSGGTVYGKGEPPFSEEDPIWPISTYGLQKASIEKIVYLYSHLYELDFRIVRPSNPYGPHQNPLGGQGAIAAFVRSALSGEDLVVLGDGSVVRDFLYIDDLVEGLLRVIRHEGYSRIFNLGSGCGTKVVDIAKTVLALTSSSSGIRFIDGRSADVPESVLDMSRFNSELGPLQLTTLNEGIERTIMYQKTQHGRKDL